MKASSIVPRYLLFDPNKVISDIEAKCGIKATKHKNMPNLF